MCQQCVDALKKFWPNLPENRWMDLLMGATSFPAGCGEQVAKDLEEMAIKSGQDIEKAFTIACEELDAAMDDLKNSDEYKHYQAEKDKAEQTDQE